MTSPPVDSTHGRTMSGVACHHRLWATQTVERRQAWHAIIAFGQHRRSDGVGRRIPSSPLASTHSRTTSGVACHHRLWAAHTAERRREWHDIIALGRQTRSNDVRLGMPSSTLGSTNGRTTSGVACHHSPWTANTVKRRQEWHAIIAFGKHKRSNDVGRGMPSYLLDVKHGRTT